MCAHAVTIIICLCVCIAVLFQQVLIQAIVFENMQAYNSLELDHQCLMTARPSIRLNELMLVYLAFDEQRLQQICPWKEFTVSK